MSRKLEISKSFRIDVTALFTRCMPTSIFIIVFLLFGLTSPRFLQPESLLNIAKQASYIGIAALGMTLVLITGGVDLSLGSTVYLSTIVAGLLMRDYGLSPVAASFVCLLAGAGIGGFNAFFITRLKILPFVVTLATMIAGRGLGLLLTKSRALEFPAAILKVGAFKLFGFLPLPILLFALSATAIQLFLSRIPLGRHYYAVGFNAENARRAGLPVDRIIASAYVLCGICASLGGLVAVTQLGIVNAGFGKGDEFDAIAAAVLGGAALSGGVGSAFPGTVIGALMIRMIWSGLVSAKINLYFQPMIFAVILFLAVMLDTRRNMIIARQRRKIISLRKDKQT
ncbi:MAG: ABC transporter permease [candidate division KSB1 bacterium]|nr:ABC transporter permease [candidate division KSB1 bacterium]